VRGGRIKYLIFNKYIVDIVENLGAVMELFLWGGIAGAPLQGIEYFPLKV
jgi:hypothetical protein